MCTLLCSTCLVNTQFFQTEEPSRTRKKHLFQATLEGWLQFSKRLTLRMANRSAVKLNSGQPDFVQFNNLACETAGGKVKTDRKYGTCRALSFSQ